MSEEAKELLAEADRLRDKAGKSSGLLSFLRGEGGGARREEQAEQAAEGYVRAANLLKGAELWRDAAAAFLQAAQVDEELLKDGEEGARKRVQAASCLRKVDAAGAAEQYQRAADVYARAGRFHMSATHLKDVGEVWEAGQQWREAAVAFGQAARRFAGEDAPALAQGCRARSAAAHSWAGNFAQAAADYQELADDCASDALRRFNQRDFLFRGLLCLLAAGDLVATERHLAHLESLDKGGRDGQLLRALVDAVRESDVDGFQAAVDLYGQVATLDDWKLHVLQEIRQRQLEDDSLA
jgi:alpha-soluble NSF attachment protein